MNFSRFEFGFVIGAHAFIISLLPLHFLEYLVYDHGIVSNIQLRLQFVCVCVRVYELREILVHLHLSIRTNGITQSREQRILKITKPIWFTYCTPE